MTGSSNDSSSSEAWSSEASVLGVRGDLRAYYEEEARIGSRQTPTGRRVELRDDFVQLLRVEGRCSVLDLGAGPGSDGHAFIEAGLEYVGVDLAHGNAVLARRAGLTVIQASIEAPPFRPRSFDAGWSMSTLMHIPAADVVGTLRAVTTALRPGAPFVVALWGGERRDVHSESGIEGQRRLFSMRPFEHNRELLAACGPIEQATMWDTGPDGWEYHVFLIRVDGPMTRLR